MNKQKYELGIAFGGGGAKGAAHCGVIQALNEYGVKPDIVAGTSAGSIVATLYAAGVKPVEMINLFISLDFKDLLEFGAPKGGLFGNENLLNKLKDSIPVKNFEDLNIPAYVVSTNLEKGKAAIFHKGEIAPRVAASCAIPVVYKPVVINGCHFVDGGVFMNLPCTAIRDKCKKVLGVTLRSAAEEKYKNNLMQVALRSFYLLFMSNTVEDSKICDWCINIDTQDYSAYDLSHIEELFNIGYDTTIKWLEAEGFHRIMPKETITFKTKEPRKFKLKKAIKSKLKKGKH